MKTTKSLLIWIILIYYSSLGYGAEIRTINLKEALRKSLKNSWQLKNTRLETLIAEDKIETAKDPYKPTFSSTLRKTHSESGATVISPIPATETEQNSWENSLSKTFRYGFSVTASGNLRDTATTAPSLGKFTDGRKNLELSLTYPLSKNRFGRSFRYPLDIAYSNKQIAELNNDYSREYQILNTVIAFYQVCLFLEEKKAVLENLKGAESVLKTMEHRSKIGTAETKHYLLSQAAYKFQTTQLIDLDNRLKKSKAELLTIMGEKDINVDYELAYALTPNTSSIHNQAEFIAAALKERKDLKQLELNLKNAEKNIALEKDSNSAELNLQSSYAYDGFNSNNTFATSETPGWFAGVTFNKKFGGTAKISETIKEKEKLKNSIADFKQEISKEVLNAFVDVNSLLKSLKETEDLLNIQTKRFNEEQKDFNLGRTSVKDLTEARDDLTLAQLNVAQSTINLLIARAKLKFVSGTLSQDSELMN